MAKRNVKTAPEERPVQDENVAEKKAEQLKGTTVGESEKVPDVVQLSEKDKSVECLAVDKKQKIYEITCRNQITKQIGGVNFENGVGHTCDDYAASWFASKDGYTVSLVK